MTAPEEEAASCPKCGSKSIQAVPVNRQNIAKALLTADLLGSTAAGVAAGSSTVIQAVCLKCGCQWLPGSEQERRIHALSGRAGPGAKLAELEAIQDEEDEASNTRIRIAVAIAVLAVIGLILVGIANH